MARKILQSENKIRNAVLLLDGFPLQGRFLYVRGDGMNILEELWYGNIYPNEQSIKKDSEYAEALRKVAGEKETLLPNLSPELQKGIEKLLDVQMEAAVIAERDAFVMGFRLAVQILVDGLTDPPITSP